MTTTLRLLLAESHSFRRPGRLRQGIDETIGMIARGGDAAVACPGHGHTRVLSDATLCLYLAGHPAEIRAPFEQYIINLNDLVHIERAGHVVTLIMGLAFACFINRPFSACSEEDL